MGPAENTRPPESPHSIPPRLRTYLFGFGLIAVAVVAIVTFSANEDDANSRGVARSECLVEVDDEYTRDEYRRMYECLEPFETIVIVEGLPDISGVYHSGGSISEGIFGDRDIVGAASVFSAFADDVGQCHVAPNGEPFQTKLTQALVDLDVDGQALPLGVLTIDVGVSGGGDPFIGAVIDNSTSGEPETIANYVPSLPNANAEITVDVIQFAGPTVNQHGGLARLSSTFHNNRDFFPFKDVQWEGDPLYNGTVTVLCGG